MGCLGKGSVAFMHDWLQMKEQLMMGNDLSIQSDVVRLYWVTALGHQVPSGGWEVSRK